MKYFIARDEDGELYLFDEEPKLYKSYIWSTSTECGRSFRIDSDLFTEVTFENSPQEVELKLCCQTETIKISDCNPKAQPCVLTNHGIDTNVVKFD